MRSRVSEQLKNMGCDAGVEDFRRVLAEVKAEMFPDWTDEQLIVTRDQAGDYCSEVKKRLKAPRLTRPFILTGLLGVRKNNRKIKM